MSPQYDAITGGEVLRIPALQSPNYAAGSTGWIIKGDGTVEFNNGTFRGSVEIGTDPGQHIIVANTVTGDAIDVYNSGNQIVFKINNAGALLSIDPVSTNYVRMNGGFIEFGNTSSPAQANPTVIGNSTASQSYVTMDSGQSTNIAGASHIRCYDTNAGSGSAYIEGFQRNVIGAVMQRSTGTGNLFHFNTYSVTTDGTGTFTFTHGAGFTPTGGMWTTASLGVPTMGYLFSFSSSTATGRAFNGGSGANTTSATFNIVAFLVG